MSKHAHIDDFSITLELPVQWGDMDAFQHVNNTRFFRFFESARIHYFKALGLDSLLTCAAVGPILAKTGCTFIAPLTYPDTLRVGCRSVKATSSRIDQEYLIHSQSMNTAAALGTAVIVAYDYTQKSKGRFPSQALQTVCAYEDLPLGAE